MSTAAGADLIYPHHECEIAQSEAETDEPFVRHWMHVAMVYRDGFKMCKSLGNLVVVDKLRESWDPRAIRVAIIEHHYRTEWELGRRAHAEVGRPARPLAGRHRRLDRRCGRRRA